MPTFTILTPVYNVEKFLMGCVHSVLNQTYPDWELILVDDGSTDTSGKLCDQLASKYPDKIRVFHQQNQGQLAARNLAVSQARGKYYVFLDSDDALTTNALQTIYDTFQKYNCDCVIYEVQIVTLMGQSLNKPTQYTPLVADKHTLYHKVFFDNKYNSLCTKAIRAGLITAQNYSKYHHIKYAEDLLQSLQILKNCQKAVFIPDQLYLYMQNPTSMTHSTQTKPLGISFEVRQQVLDFIQKSGLFTTQDMQDYHRYAISLFEGEIKISCRKIAPLPDKINLFCRIKEEPYYQQFLASKTYKQPLTPLYTQFRLGLYRLLVWEVQCYDFFRNLLRR